MQVRKLSHTGRRAGAETNRDTHNIGQANLVSYQMVNYRQTSDKKSYEFDHGVEANEKGQLARKGLLYPKPMALCGSIRTRTWRDDDDRGGTPVG